MHWRKTEKMAFGPLPLQYYRRVRVSAYSRNRHNWAWNHFGRRPFASDIHLDIHLAELAHEREWP
jgi:hypothetical protein